MLVKPEETRFYWKLLYTGGRTLLYLNVHTSIGVCWMSILWHSDNFSMKHKS